MGPPVDDGECFRREWLADEIEPALCIPSLAGNGAIMDCQPARTSAAGLAIRAGDRADGGGGAGAGELVAGAVARLAGGAVGGRAASRRHPGALLPTAVGGTTRTGRPCLLGGSLELADPGKG